MKPTIGRIVVFKARDTSLMGYGVTEVPALITRVLSDTRVNLTVFRDGSGPQAVMGIEYGTSLGDHTAIWWWPERESDKFVPSAANRPKKDHVDVH